MKLLEALRAFPGNYEIHITVAIDGAAELARFEGFCAAHGAKALVIQLSNGETPRQPMLSLRLKAEPEAVAQRIEGLAAALVADGFSLLRLKVEADIRNANIPRGNREGHGLPGYFEHHLRLRLPLDLELAPLAAELKRFDGHLSANALIKDLGGFQERYVTQRFYGVGLNFATQQLERLLSYCSERALSVTRRIQEYIVYDSDIGLDRGWIENRAETAKNK
ncbi:MAG TPA: hypothetical protein V6D23_15370 [Candidatus Obscuribacterales bacterium]